MKEHEELLGLAENEDDVPVALCIVKNGRKIDWKESLPEEVLYIPESKFETIGREFIRKVGSDYYSTVDLSGPLLNELKNLLSEGLSSTESEKLRQCITQMSEFINKGEQLSETHYLVFEGP